VTSNLKTVAQFADATPFTEHQLRWWIFQAENNGLAKSGAIVRISRRVYIDTAQFDAWIASQNPSSAECSATATITGATASASAGKVTAGGAK